MESYLPKTQSMATPMLVFAGYVMFFTVPVVILMRALHKFFIRRHLAIHRSEIYWSVEESLVVGMKTFDIELFKDTGEPYAITTNDDLTIEIMNHERRIIESAVEIRGASGNRATVSFTVCRAGSYSITVRVGQDHLPGSPFIRHFYPGPIDGTQSTLCIISSMLLCVEGDQLQLQVKPEDRYGNLCLCSPDDNYTDFSFQLTETCNGKQLFPPLNAKYNEVSKSIALDMNFDQKGFYQALITHCGKTLMSGKFTLLVLSKQDMANANRAVAKRSQNLYFKAQLITDRAPLKHVFCYLTSKQLIIKEFILIVIPLTLFTFQISTSTKFQFLEDNYMTDPVVVIRDGTQPPIFLATKDRMLIAACFTNFLLKNVGYNYKTFEDKQERFYRRIQEKHDSNSEWIRQSRYIKSSRQNLLETSMLATEYFKVDDWRKKFVVFFEGEAGLDWGGLRREWFGLLCHKLFDSNKSGLFSSLNDDPQAAVHPNRQRQKDLTLEHYEFAGKIVGKCLYESAMGDQYTQLVNARFTQSFLAQLLDRPVNYKYFEKDDPELYTGKVKYLKENDVDDMELTFTEEEFKDGKLCQVHELTCNGAETPVTNENKELYLDCLAEFRLRRSVSDEIDSFMKGFNLLIPPHLLSDFSEKELELLLYGSDNYSVTDFKQNHTTEHGLNGQQQKVLRWFWKIVEDFTHHQMALLLQFTTGSSRLPVGGFGKLSPKFDISFVSGCDRLPTAHTCFNSLRLTDYRSMDSMRDKMLKGINEGSQGFGFM